MCSDDTHQSKLTPTSPTAGREQETSGFLSEVDRLYLNEQYEAWKSRQDIQRAVELQRITVQQAQWRYQQETEHYRQRLELHRMEAQQMLRAANRTVERIHSGGYNAFITRDTQPTCTPADPYAKIRAKAAQGKARPGW
jgi:hypothetical protein